MCISSNAVNILSIATEIVYKKCITWASNQAPKMFTELFMNHAIVMLKV